MQSNEANAIEGFRGTTG